MSTHLARQPPVNAAEYAQIEERLRALVQTTRDVVLLQGESILALEAMARGVGAPTTRSLNVITSPYGAALGRWLGAAGGSVENVDVGLRRGVRLPEVEAVLDRGQVDIVSVVHAEAATGARSPVAEIAARAHAAGALMLVDAVASIGAEPLAIDEWDLDLTAISAQKALGGPAGVCAVAISDRAWLALENNPAAPRDSALSLLDWREHWIATGRRELPQIPHHLETRALAAALDLIEQEGLDTTILRHQRSRDAARAGLRALGLEPWVVENSGAAAIATLVASPDGVEPSELLAAARAAVGEAPLGLAPGVLAQQALRISHTGEDARLAPVLAALAGLALGLCAVGVDVDAGAAVAAAVSGWQELGAAAATPAHQVLRAR
jgi:aspartate aminotransferase-like enzyme